MSLFLVIPIIIFIYVASRLSLMIIHSRWFLKNSHQDKKALFWLKVKVWGILLSVFIFIMFVFTLRRGLTEYLSFLADKNTIYILKYLAFIWLGIFSLTFVSLLIVDICALLVKTYGLIRRFIGKTLKPNQMQKEQAQINFNRRSLLISGAFVSTSSVLGANNASANPQIIYVDIPIRNLPATFENYTIAQISDLHLGDTLDEKYALKVVEQTNALNPDIIALTGDFVDGKVSDIEYMTQPLKQLKARGKIFMVSGNHEYYSGWDEWEKVFTDYGFEILSNQNRIIERAGDKIAICGVTDLSTKKPQRAYTLKANMVVSDPNAALLGIDPNLVKILLAHQPGDYATAAKAGYDLMISGHTHGGQYFPFNLVIKVVHRYYKGLNLHDKMWVYVSRGTGFWGPPIRTMTANEITLFRLKMA